MLEYIFIMLEYIFIMLEYISTIWEYMFIMLEYIFTILEYNFGIHFHHRYANGQAGAAAQGTRPELYYTYDYIKVKGYM